MTINNRPPLSIPNSANLLKDKLKTNVSKYKYLKKSVVLIENILTNKK